MLFQTATSGGSCNCSGWCSNFSYSYRLQALAPVTFSTCSCSSAPPLHVMKVTALASTSVLLLSRLSVASCDLSNFENLLNDFPLVTNVPCLFCAYYVSLCSVVGTVFVFRLILLQCTHSCIFHVPSVNFLLVMDLRVFEM